MIISDKGFIRYDGKRTVIMAELTGIIHKMVESEDFTKEDINLCLETAYKTREQISEETKKAVDLLDKLINDILE